MKLLERLSSTWERWKRTKFPWSSMKMLQSIHFLKASYAVLIAVPLVALVAHPLGVLAEELVQAYPQIQPDIPVRWQPALERTLRLVAGILQSLSTVPLLLKIGYFSSVCLSVAHMLYQAFCPEIIKRFSSPNDLYRDLLQIRQLQLTYLPSDRLFEESFTGIDHCRAGFAKAKGANWAARFACYFMYLFGLLLFGTVLVLQALRVWGVFLV